MRAAYPRLWYVHRDLAGALGLRGDLDEARAALAKAIELKPEMNSLAWLRAYPGASDLRYWALYEKTVAVGLRRAGFPVESLPPAASPRSSPPMWRGIRG